MKISIVYSSLSGCTRKVAEALYEGLAELPYVERSLADVTTKPDVSDADIVCFGYWVDKGGPNEKAAEWFSSVHGKRVFVFSTLAYNVDSKHGFEAGWKGVELAESQGNEVIGHFTCNGHLSDSLIQRFKRMAAEGKDSRHAFTPEKGIRYEIMASHPTAAELALGAERLRERVEYCRRVDELRAGQK